jgi:hypothetical protein
MIHLHLEPIWSMPQPLGVANRKSARSLRLKEVRELQHLQDLAHDLESELHLGLESDEIQPSGQNLVDVRKLLSLLVRELARVQGSPPSRKISRTLAQNLGCLVRQLVQELAQEPALAQKLQLAKELARELTENLNQLAREMAHV